MVGRWGIVYLIECKNDVKNHPLEAGHQRLLKKEG
jgi:hypothetical protein